MVILDGYKLTINDLIKIAYTHEQVKIKKTQWRKIEDAEKFIKKQVTSNRTVYGFNTGFGALAQVRISARDIKRLQHNILLSHYAGVGKPFAPELVRAAVCLRINTLIRGHSGVSEQLIKNLVAILNKDIIPIVPQKGSVGASGDLAPLAAIGLVLIGKGKVLYNGKTISAKKALRLAGIKILELKPKEGLSLINGTQFSTGIAGLINHIGIGLCDIADTHGAMSLDALKGTDTPFNKNIFELRPHPGAIKSAKNIKNLIKGSHILKSHKDCQKVQDPYSLRCMAQVHGAVRDIFYFAKKTIEIEMNSVTDNPLVFPDKNLIMSSGNFHAEPVAFALDMMAIGLAELASISERRIFRLLDSKLSGLNAFLTMKPGLNSGFMMAQVTAAALVSQNKILCHPASVDSIPTSANQEDHVSMSMNAGLKALEVLENTKYVLAIEIFCACQALDLLKPLKTSPALEKIKKRIRKLVPFNKTDQPLTPEIEKIKGIIEKDLIK
ncbi:histidine ammonia-lyase [candidate division WOR-3 bacterium]|nr:histidine ammonia-lyase [candidate division WOR-3 bacterium]